MQLFAGFYVAGVNDVSVRVVDKSVLLEGFGRFLQTCDTIVLNLTAIGQNYVDINCIRTILLLSTKRALLKVFSCIINSYLIAVLYKAPAFS